MTDAIVVISNQQKEIVRDIRWSPQNSTVFASVTASQVALYDLMNDQIDPIAVFKSDWLSASPLEKNSKSSTDSISGVGKIATGKSYMFEEPEDNKPQFTAVEFLTPNSLLVGDDQGTVRELFLRNHTEPKHMSFLDSCFVGVPRVTGWNWKNE